MAGIGSLTLRSLQTTLTVFTSRRKAQHVTCRLVEADARHRYRAVVEQVIAELKQGRIAPALRFL